MILDQNAPFSREAGLIRSELRPRTGL